PRPRVELRLPGRRQHRRVLHLVPSPQGRHRRAAADPHPARGGIRAAPARLSRPPMVRFVADVPLRVKLIAAMLALVTMALVVIGVASAVVMRNSLLNRIDEQLRSVSQLVAEGSVQGFNVLAPKYLNFVWAASD